MAQDQPASSMSECLLLSAGKDCATVWEAVLWKRSRFLKCWRERHIKLTDAGNRWELSAVDAATAQLTGVWELQKSSTDIQLLPKYGFKATMVLSGLALAAKTSAEVEALVELAAFVRGSCRRDSSGDSSVQGGSAQTQPSREPSPDARSVNEATTAEAQSSHQAKLDLSIERPSCENCSGESAKGRLIVHPTSGTEIGRWLCKRCFISAWSLASDGLGDGRFQSKPKWMALTPDGKLVNSSPPCSRRYTPVCSR
mmetsp:Transcript_158949/g.289844  ORF Transcript_158949/g.289844 Transcript_158949/m.289844 type:complete len:255 (-) Transcript_158949:47-811(-)